MELLYSSFCYGNPVTKLQSWSFSQRSSASDFCHELIACHTCSRHCSGAAERFVWCSCFCRRGAEVRLVWHCVQAAPQLASGLDRPTEIDVVGGGGQGEAGEAVSHVECLHGDLLNIR